MFALFIVVILGFIVQHTSATTYKCSCQCPHGSNQEFTYTTEYSLQTSTEAYNSTLEMNRVEGKLELEPYSLVFKVFKKVLNEN